jgi:hypothetical protein
MSDERTYGFSLHDATELVSGIRSSEGWYPEIKPRGGGGSGSGETLLFGFELTAEKFVTSSTVNATIYELDGEDFGSSLGVQLLHDPAKWYGPANTGTRGLCFKQAGKYYAIQSACGPEEYL